MVHSAQILRADHNGFVARCSCGQDSGARLSREAAQRWAHWHISYYPGTTTYQPDSANPLEAIVAMTDGTT